MSKPHPQKHNSVAEMHFFWIMLLAFDQHLPLLFYLLSDGSLKIIVKKREKLDLCDSSCFSNCNLYASKTRLVNLTLHPFTFS